MIDKITNLPSRSQTNEAFIQSADGAWPQLNRFADQANALGDDVTAKQLSSTASALSAAASATAASMSETNAAASATAASQIAGASKWIAGAYINGQAVWSPSTYLAYRKKGDGNSAIDPANDSANWVALSVKSNGLTNVQTLNANIVLDQASAQYQRLTPAVAGLDISLPDATSISTGFDVFKFKNMGAYGLGVCDKSASILGYLRAADETFLDLLSNSAAAGVWDVQSTRSPLDVADTVNSAGVAGAVAVSANYAKYRNAQLSASLGLQAYVSSAGNTTVVAVDLTTGALGTPAAAQADATAANTAFALFPLNATQALLVFNNNRMVVLTVAGLTISYGTAVTLSTTYGLFTPAGSGGTPNIIKLSASLFLTIGGWSSPVQTTAISIAGSVITQSVVSVAGISEGWSAYVSWVALSATSALCTYTSATGNSTPYTNYTFVVTVSSGVQAHGAAISRGVGNQSTAQPLLPYSSTKALQLINQAANVYARVLTIAGAVVSTGAEQLIRSDATEGALASFATLQSITNTNAYNYSAFAQDIGSFPMGGTYFASQSKAGYLDILNVNFAASTVGVAAQAINAGSPVLTDTGYHLTCSYAGGSLTVGRLQLSAAGATALASTVIAAKSATTFSYSVGKNYVYAVGATPSGASLAYSILLTDTGLLKASANYSASQSSLALRAATEYPLQFTLGGRVWATQSPANNTVSIARLV